MSKKPVKKPVKKLTFKFTPQKMSRKLRLEFRVTNFKPRTQGYHAWSKRPLNEVVLGRLFSMLHGKLGHGLPIDSIRWKQAGIRMDSHFPKKSSSHYHNTFSAGRIF